MAILSGFPGLEVAVTVNGDALHEYDLPDDIEEIMTDGSTIKYIEARPGTEFAIRCEIEPTFEYSENDLYLNVTVDNYLAHAKFMSTGVQTETLTGPLMASGKKLIERNWVFSTLKTVGGPTGETEEALRERSKKFGQIVVHLHRVTIGQKKKKNLEDWKNERDARDETIPEKALKGRALSLKTGFGAARTHENQYYYDYDWIDDKDEPFATFVFRYRSMDDLHAERIVPKPIPLEERDISTLTVEELNELLKRQAADLERQELQRRVEENREKLKGGTGVRKEEKKDVKKEIKREHDSAFGRGSGSNAPKRRQVETIDLIEDEVEIKTEIEHGCGSASRSNGNPANSKKRRNKTVDLTDD